MEYLSQGESETEELGRRLAGSLTPGMVVAFRGDLGVGKTAFIRGIARGLGYVGRVTSPTFAIVNEYESTPPLFHFDMYRLDSAEELFDIGWDDYLERKGICVVEWSEQISEALPENALIVEISRVPDHENQRMIAVKGVDSL